MVPFRVVQNANRIDALIALMDESVIDADSRIQSVFANHIVLAGAGYVEQAVLAVLSEYGRQHGNPKLARFVEKQVARNNSLNCEKIGLILNQFDKSWWRSIEEKTAPENTAAVDSIKTLRDQIAHGKPNGTGYITVKDYYTHAKAFVSDFASVVCS